MASSQSKYYLDLSLPLDAFIKCISGNFSGLIISGKPSQADLAEAWANIYVQYLDVNYENDVLFSLQLEKEIALLTLHISEVEICVYFLSVRYRVELVKILGDNGYRDKFPSEIPSEYVSVLNIIKGRLAMKKQSLTGKQNELDAYIESVKNNTLDEKYFAKWLVRLAKHQGVGILRAKEITVMEFSLIMKDYLEFVSLNNKAYEDAKQGNYK